MEKAKQVAAGNPNAKIDVHFLDLASFKSVHSFVESIIDNEPRIDCLINNAAVVESSYQKTEDGFERAKQVNFIAPLLLTCLLLPLIEKSKGRIVNMSSFSHIEFDSIQMITNERCMEGRKYHSMKNYKTAKLASLLASRYLSKKLSTRCIRVYTVDPGIAQTKLADPSYSKIQMILPMLKKIVYLFIRTPIDASESLVLAAIDAGDEYVAGEKYYLYYGTYVDPSPIAMDDNNAKLVWSHFLSLIGDHVSVNI